MSACRDENLYEHPDAHESLPLDLLKDAAELRAAGHDWKEVGAALNRNPFYLRLACRHDPRFEAEMDLARREVAHEMEAEMLRKMREQMRSEDTRISVTATEKLAKYLTARRNCETRVQVEDVKKEAKLVAKQTRSEVREPNADEAAPRNHNPARIVDEEPHGAAVDRPERGESGLLSQVRNATVERPTSAVA